MSRPDVTVILESYNHVEGPSGLDRLRIALEAATRMLEEHGNGALLVTDAADDGEVSELLEREFPKARIVAAAGLDYDGAKLEAARQAESDVVLFLDGDCIPEPGWLCAHLAAFEAGHHATAGFTRYDGGWRGAVESVLDFGFMLPPRDRVAGCYGSNNAGFRRETLLEVPPPAGAMRCRCYAHAQELMRRGKPVWMVPGAKTRHERQPLVEERYRQGFDAVAACWVDPALREARLLKLGVFAAPLFYARAVLLDWRRILVAHRDLGLATWQAVASLPLFPLLRLIDLAGMLRALAPGGRTSGVGLKAVET
ncbi:MAG: glycosyltransferase family A protein [Actinomycetota bacterium]